MFGNGDEFVWNLFPNQFASVHMCASASSHSRCDSVELNSFSLSSSIDEVREATTKECVAVNGLLMLHSHRRRSMCLRQNH